MGRTWLLSQWGKSIKSCSLFLKRIKSKSKEIRLVDHSKYMNFQEKQRQEEFAMTEVGFPVCNDGNRVRKFAMPECRNRLQ